MRLPSNFFVVLCAWLVLASTGVAARTVVIDAGHGGHDRGGLPRQRYSEKLYALDVARRLENNLRRCG